MARSMPAWQITVARSASEMDQLTPLWERLLQQQPHSVFQRFAWNRLAASAFRDRITPHVICVEGDSGAAIIPAGINHPDGHLELLGETLFDYRDILHAGDPEALQVAWEQLSRLNLPFSAAGLIPEGHWTRFTLEPFAKAPFVDGTLTTGAEFRQAHPRLQRQLRRLSRLGLSYRSYCGEHSEIVRRLYEVKAEQFPADSNNLFRDPARREFMVSLAELEREGCDVFTLEAQGGKLVAGILTFRDQRIRRFYTIYFHPGWARYSPGVALLYEVTAQSLAEGLSCDYMTGEYPYKLRLANSSRSLYKVDISSSELAEMAKRRLIAA